ncbi:hypothetical protein ACEZ3G_04490 [Maribacter algicola]|uniref:Uncharacterized protein n=1 Tax=Meishania litoralis TaxID=3434685 RepID=A0ACC7LH21_9FLAO
MDKEKAHIVVLTNGAEKMHTFYSNVETYNPKGGSRSKTKWGPQDVVQDSKYLEREKHQFREYFRSLAEMVEHTDELALFGPADTAEKFKAELVKNHLLLASKLKTVAKADSMTDNQIKALVRDFYKVNT